MKSRVWSSSIHGSSADLSCVPYLGSETVSFSFCDCRQGVFVYLPLSHGLCISICEIIKRKVVKGICERKDF